MKSDAAHAGSPAGICSSTISSITSSIIPSIIPSLAAEGYSLKLRGFSAIDKYLRMPALPYTWAETSANIAILARFMDNLHFPGMEIADGAIDTPEGTCYFRCLESGEQNKASFPLLSLTYDLETGHFQDPLGIYPLIRKLHSIAGAGATGGYASAGETGYYGDAGETAGATGGYAGAGEASGEKTPLTLEEAGFLENAASSGASRYRLIMDASLLLSRYSFAPAANKYLDKFSEALSNCREEPQPGPETQKAFLSCLLVSPQPYRGFDILKRSGFLKELWPELSGFDDVDHSKEFHPEGNVWSHTMETFRHRKALGSGAFDLRLSLGLLLHDAGKPIAASSGSRRFDGHAELGAKAAARFLERLGFEAPLVDDIFYLVKNHMLPAALKRLPLTKTREIMASPLFPTLMELYRCDESSSFKGLDDYYENSAAYQNYLRNLRNPYRSADGKKIGRKEMLKR